GVLGVVAGGGRGGGGGGPAHAGGGVAGGGGGAAGRRCGAVQRQPVRARPRGTRRGRCAHAARRACLDCRLAAVRGRDLAAANNGVMLMLVRLSAVLVAVAALLAVACSQTPPHPAAPAAQTAPWRLDLGARDLSVKPGDAS